MTHHKAPKLTDAEIAAAVASVSGWRRQGEEIQKTFSRPTFLDAVAFVNHVAELAERADHHPDMLIQWNRVTLTLTTHDSGGLTRKDFDLAARIDALEP
jgi:4a-hydroxytetrahydrobiopterin dehydratase